MFPPSFGMKLPRWLACVVRIHPGTFDGIDACPAFSAGESSPSERSISQVGLAKKMVI